MKEVVAMAVTAVTAVTAAVPLVYLLQCGYPLSPTAAPHARVSHGHNDTCAATYGSVIEVAMKRKPQEGHGKLVQIYSRKPCWPEIISKT
jgi:hypothetical protein